MAIANRIACFIVKFIDPQMGTETTLLDHCHVVLVLLPVKFIASH